MSRKVLNMFEYRTHEKRALLLAARQLLTHWLMYGDKVSCVFGLHPSKQIPWLCVRRSMGACNATARRPWSLRTMMVVFIQGTVMATVIKSESWSMPAAIEPSEKLCGKDLLAVAMYDL